MSRIGKRLLKIPSGVQVSLIAGNTLVVKGSKGELKQKVSERIQVDIKDNQISFTRKDDELQTRAFHGLYNTLALNMMTGVVQGFQKKLELVGVGFKAAVQGNLLDVSIGYSHNVLIEIPKEIKASAAQEKGQNPIVTLESHDKELLGLVASRIRALRKPEPYQGKGIRYVGEYIRRKSGKSASGKK